MHMILSLNTPRPATCYHIQYFLFHYRKFGNCFLNQKNQSNLFQKNIFFQNFLNFLVEKLGNFIEIYIVIVFIFTLSLKTNGDIQFVPMIIKSSTNIRQDHCIFDVPNRCIQRKTFERNVDFFPLNFFVMNTNLKYDLKIFS